MIIRYSIRTLLWSACALLPLLATSAYGDLRTRSATWLVINKGSKNLYPGQSQTTAPAFAPQLGQAPRSISPGTYGAGHVSFWCVTGASGSTIQIPLPPSVYSAATPLTNGKVQSNAKQLEGATATLKMGLLEISGTKLDCRAHFATGEDIGIQKGSYSSTSPATSIFVFF